MRRFTVTFAWGLIACLAASDRTLTAAEPNQGRAHQIRLELALQYDFFLVQSGQVRDASGHKHDGQLQGGEIVPGKQKLALKLDGQGLISLRELPDSLSPQQRPFTVGALCKPAAAEGVIAALGDKSNGFRLALRGGVPQFAIRVNGELTTVSAADPVPLEQWVHVAGAIDSQGKLWVIVNGWPKANVQGRLIPGKPAQSFSVGADASLPAGDTTAAPRWQGLLEDVRLYWGFLDRTEQRDVWQDWADLPGCGCRQ